MKTLFAFLFCAALASGQAVVINGVSPSFGNFTLPAGGCLTQDVTVTGVTTTMMTPVVSPRTFPGNGITWQGYVKAADTVTLKVCSSIAQYVPASIYDINVSTGQPGAAGTVTSVSATAPIQSTGGNTPVISCPTCSTATPVTAVSAAAPIVSTGGTTPQISCPTCFTGTAITAPVFSQGATATVATSAFTSITTATNQLGSRTLAANFFSAAGSVLHVYAAGTFTTTASPGPLQFRLTLGGTVICSGSVAGPAVPVSATQGAWSLDTYVTVYAVGASSAAHCASGGVMVGDAGGGTSGGMRWFDNGNLINTTGTLAFDLLFSWTSFVSGDAITATNVVLSQL